MSKRNYEYIATKNGTSNDGTCHFVTVIGAVEQDNVWEVDTHDVQVEHVKPNSFVNGVLAYPKRKFKRTVKLAYSICHPDDDTSLEYGEKLARKRLENNPLGVATTEYVTMFQKEDLAHLVTAKLEYICDNLDKFIGRRSKKND